MTKENNISNVFNAQTVAIVLGMTNLYSAEDALAEFIRENEKESPTQYKKQTEQNKLK